MLTIARRAVALAVVLAVAVAAIVALDFPQPTEAQDDIFPANRFPARQLIDESASKWLRSSPITMPAERPEPMVGEVGTGGGFATAEDGATLVVPAGAARHGAEITAHTIADGELPPLPGFASAYLAAWDFNVEGGIRSSVTSRLPLPDPAESWAHVHFVDGEWALTPFRIENDTVVAELESLSRFAIVRLRDLTDTAPAANVQGIDARQPVGAIAADSGPRLGSERQRPATTAATSNICRNPNGDFSAEINPPFTQAAIKGCTEGTIYAPVFTIENPQPYWQQVCSALDSYERGAGHVFQFLADCRPGTIGTVIPPKSFAVWRASGLVPLEQFSAYFGPVPMIITVFEWILYIIPLGEIVDLRGNWELLHYVQETLLRVPEIDRFIGHLTSGDWFGAIPALAKAIVNGGVWKALQKVLSSEIFWSKLGERAGFTLNKAALAKASAVANFGRLASYLWTLIKASNEVGAGMLMGAIGFSPSREALRLIRERGACRRQARETGEPCAADQQEAAAESRPIAPSVTSLPAVEPEAPPPIGNGSLIVLAGTSDLYQTHVVNGSLFKRLILNPVVFNGYRFQLSDVRSVEQAEFDRWTTTDLARLGDDARVWRLFPDGGEGVQRWLDITPQQFEAAGFDWDAVIPINRTEFYAWREGPPITAVELGLESVSDDTPPADESRVSAVSAITVGAKHACALLDSGAVECWGDNTWGQADAPGGTFTAISAGYDHTCGLRPSGAVECWGSNDSGETDAPSGTFSAISAGDDHTCGLRPSGAVECWGSNDSGETDAPSGTFSAISAGEDHTCGLRPSGAVECWGSNWAGQTDALEGRFTAVGAGYWHACGLRVSGAIGCWTSYLDETDAPDGTFTAVSVGRSYACGLRANGAVECWSLWSYDEADAPGGSFTAISAGAGHTCGLRPSGAVECRGIAAAAAPSGSFSAVSAGINHSCGLRPSGAVECWGSNNYGETDAPDGSFSAVSAGHGWHTCGLRPSGAVECWGGNTHGETDAPSGTFSAISVGWWHTCGLRPSGAVECWGSNWAGQSDAPGGSFNAVSAGGRHACGLRPSGAVECWGYTFDGQAQPPAGKHTAISAGADHACALSEDGTVACWVIFNGAADVPAWLRGTEIEVSGG